MRLSVDHSDALMELVNIGIGRAAAELNEMLDSPIELEVPNLLVTTRESASKNIAGGDESVAMVQLPFEGSFAGRAFLAFSPSSASALVGLLVDDLSDDVALDNVRVGTLTEVGNILLNSVMGSITNTLDAELRYRVPSFYEVDRAGMLSLQGREQEAIVMVAEARFRVQDRAIEGQIHLVFAVDGFDALLRAIDRASAA